MMCQLYTCWPATETIAFIKPIFGNTGDKIGQKCQRWNIVRPFGELKNGCSLSWSLIPQVSVLEFAGYKIFCLQ